MGEISPFRVFFQPLLLGGVLYWFQVACNTSEAIQKQLIALDADANEALKTCLEELEGGGASAATAVGGGDGSASAPRPVRREKITLSAELAK